MPLRTKYDVPTAAIAAFSLVTSLLVSFFTENGPLKITKPVAHISLATHTFIIITSVIIAYCLLLFLYFYIARGYQWARILFVIFFLVGALFLAFTLKKTLSIGLATTLSTVNFVVQWVLGILSAGLAALGIKEYSRLTRNKI